MNITPFAEPGFWRTSTRPAGREAAPSQLRLAASQVAAVVGFYDAKSRIRLAQAAQLDRLRQFPKLLVDERFLW